VRSLGLRPTTECKACEDRGGAILPDRRRKKIGENSREKYSYACERNRLQFRASDGKLKLWKGRAHHLTSSTSQMRGSQCRGGRG